MDKLARDLVNRVYWLLDYFEREGIALPLAGAERVIAVRDASSALRQAFYEKDEAEQKAKQDACEPQERT